MADVAIIKRISEIGAELVLLERQRNEIDNRTTTLIREAHRLTRPKGTNYDGEPIETLPPAIVNSGAHLMRNGAPTNRSRVLTFLVETNRAVTKYEIAQALGLNPQQAHYCLVGLHKAGLAVHAAKGEWVLSEKGREASNRKVPAALQPPITVEASQDPPFDTP